MVVQIDHPGGGPDPKATMQRMHDAIAETIPNAEIQVTPKTPGHFEIRVASSLFDGQTRLKQHQLVYSAIWDLMSGHNPPVHAIDRLDCVVP